MNERQRLKETRERFFEGISVPERKPFVPDPFQLEAINALREGHDTLVIAPTGAGKTYIAVEAIRHTVDDKKRAVYTAPLKALSNAKYSEFKRIFEPAHSVGLLTGDRKIDGDASVVVATTEIYRNELFGYKEHYSLVVLDEIHYLADPQRGPVWEESIILSPRSSRLLMLSASISNPIEIADWIGEVRGKKVHVVSVSHRPVELRYGFLHPDLGIVPLEDTEQPGAVTSDVSRFYSGESPASRVRGFRHGRGGSNRRRGRR